jgi:hypothetical protein
VKEWELMWTHFFDAHALPAALNVPGALMAPKFPPGLKQALDAEIAAVKELAG